MNKEILKLAKEHNACTMSKDGKVYCVTFGNEELEAFYRAAFNAGLEAAAKVVDANIKQCSPTGYLQEVLVSNAAAIRALEIKP